MAEPITMTTCNDKNPLLNGQQACGRSTTNKFLILALAFKILFSFHLGWVFYAWQRSHVGWSHRSKQSSTS